MVRWLLCLVCCLVCSPLAAPAETSWRTLVSDSFQKRRQTPAASARAASKLAARSEALLPVSIPKLPTRPAKSASVLSGEPDRRSMRQQLVDEIRQAREEEKEQAEAALIAAAEEAAQPAAASASASAGRRRSGPASASPIRGSTSAVGSRPVKSPGGVKLMQLRGGAASAHAADQAASSESGMLGGTRPSDPAQAIQYTVAPAPVDALYKTSRSELEKLPLELFDNAELWGDLTAEEWIELGRTKYGNKGTPARSSFYANKEYSWLPCRVLEYDPASGDFLIEFSQAPFLQKVVKRLSILFDDEDQEKFYKRLESCRRLREEALAQRRYNAFLDAQATSIFAPIQQSALHGIVGKLMMNSEALVMSRQKSVEGLLIEVREEYGLAMKYAIVDYKRHFLGAEEEARIAHLMLPPKTVIKPAPRLAVISIPRREVAMSRAIKLMETLHYTHHPEATQVILALYRSWDGVKHGSFLDTNDDALDLPMTLFEYQDHQDSHFSSHRERIQNDWRALVINLIRDNLNNVYSLFINDAEVYAQSELKRFLKMTGCMLRTQLSNAIEESMAAYVGNMLAKYSHPLGNKPELLREKFGPDYQLTDADLLDGYLSGSSLSSFSGRAGSGTRPLFLFKMSTSGSEVIFLPGLESIELTVLGLVNLPAKLQSIAQIDNDVVPLLGMQDDALCSATSVPELYRSADRYKRQLQTLIADNLRQPLALKELYAPYSALLAINTEQYVYAWFHPYEVEQKKRAEALAAAGMDGKETVDEQTKQKELALFSEENMLEDEEDAAEGGASAAAKKNAKSNPWGVPGEDDAEKKEADRLAAEAKAKAAADEERKRRGHTLAETHAEILKYQTAITEIQNCSPSEVTFHMLKIELHLLKEQLISKAKEVSNKLLEGLAGEIRQQNLDITTKFESMLARIKKKSTSVNELAELKSFSRQVETVEIPKLQKEIDHMQEKIRCLMLFRYPISRADFNLSWNVNRYPLHLMEGMEDTKLQIELDNSHFQKQLQEEQGRFQIDLEEYAQEVQSFIEFGMGTTAQMEQYASKVEALQDKLQAAEAKVASFNERDQLFGDVPMVYDELTAIKAKFKPFFELWSTTSLFNGSYSVWMTGPFVELDPVQIGKDVSAWHKLMYKLERELLADDAVKPSKVATEMKAKIQEFKSNLPVISWLRNPGLRQRHWDKLSATLAPGRQAFLTPDADLTLSQILALDIASHKSAIEDISSTATKEYQLELQLDKMAKEWRTVTLEIEPYKATGSYILKGTEDVLGLLDDQIMKTGALRGSPYIKVWENRSKKWESKLMLVQEIMDQWLQCQKTWMYLSPLFGSEDITRQMPVESRRFGVVDAYWRKTMEAAKKQGNIMDFVTDTDNLLKTFQESNKMLDMIGKHLNDYLETKRLAFPRFYFLSNDELLGILSQTKNVHLVQPHLSKIFDAMYRVHFHNAAAPGATEKKEIITGMYSSEGEFVTFTEPIDPNEGARKGNVEIWLKEVERVMKDTLKTITTKQMIAYAKTVREKWITDEKLPGQTCLAVSSLYWTKQTTEALGKKNGLVAYLSQLNKQLEKLVELVRGELTPLARATLGALTVMDVHARDVVAKMVEEGVKSDKDFEWLSQMRFYHELDPKGSSMGGPAQLGPDEVAPGTLKVRMINAQMDYAYEYLGNSTRLVITPLTDRCYRTLCGAVHLHLGGAPEGPAGTGKTETVKDLSKAIAIQCVVFNCSDALNFRSMAKFFKGLAASGAWSCFDEFNRIELEVLSVIAQQVASIQRAVIEGKHTFFFDNVNIPLIHTCSVFITMNPGYAGRAELPDNLKALFRTVAMMIPDYALIAEIVLYSYGYSGARGLARKIVGCLRLSSEQLSSQDHYDFGMRTVKSILLAAGTLKAQMPHADEEWLIVRSISDVNLPKFVTADIPLFNGIVRDLFPAVDPKVRRRQDNGACTSS